MNKTRTKNENRTFIKIQRAADKIGRSEQKVIGEYWDEKRNCKVRVLAGPEDKPYLTVPIGITGD